MRNYTLPQRREGEDNWEWCQRAAATIPAEELMQTLVEYLDERAKKRRRREAWSVIGQITGHGSGISNAIVERFRRKGA